MFKLPVALDKNENTSLDLEKEPLPVYSILLSLCDMAAILQARFQYHLREKLKALGFKIRKNGLSGTQTWPVLDTETGKHGNTGWITNFIVPDASWDLDKIEGDIAKKLYQGYFPIFYTLFVKTGKVQQDKKTACYQHVFGTFWDRVARGIYRGDANLETYFKRTADKEVLAFFREEKRFKYEAVDDPDKTRDLHGKIFDFLKEDNHDTFTMSELLTYLQYQGASWEDTNWMDLFFAQGFSHKEIASIVGYSGNTPANTHFAHILRRNMVLIKKFFNSDDHL